MLEVQCGNEGWEGLRKAQSDCFGLPVIQGRSVLKYDSWFGAVLAQNKYTEEIHHASLKLLINPIMFAMQLRWGIVAGGISLFRYPVILL